MYNTTVCKMYIIYCISKSLFFEAYVLHPDRGILGCFQVKTNTYLKAT